METQDGIIVVGVSLGVRVGDPGVGTRVGVLVARVLPQIIANINSNFIIHVLLR